MPKLSNVLGGLLRDLAQSHSISDAHAIDTAETYRRDPLLAHLPVPRMAIREAHLKLRFAVADVQDPVVEADPDELRDMWLRTVSEQIVPKALTEVGRIDNKRVVAAFNKRLASSAAGSFVDPDAILGEGREDELVKSTLQFLAAQVESLPPSTRRSVENTDLDATFERVVRAEMADLRAAARQLEQARRAAQSDINVLVTTETLGAVPEAQISELDVTVTMEELQFGGIPGAPTRED
jgi:hypothetical protein